MDESHTLRKSDEAIEKQAIDWNPQEARKRGRSKTMWKRTVCNEIGHWAYFQIFLENFQKFWAYFRKFWGIFSKNFVHIS
jgi:hypothetical protein